MTAKPSANERRLAKLLRDINAACDFQDADEHLEVYAANLARRGVLAVNKVTVPDIPPSYYHSDDLRRWLRGRARGGR